jgi:hypothetical protein
LKSFLQSDKMAAVAMQSPKHGQQANADCFTASHLFYQTNRKVIIYIGYKSASLRSVFGGQRMNRRQTRVVITALLLLGLLASLPLGAHYAQSAQAQKQNPALQFKPRQHNHAQDGEQAAGEMSSSGFVIVRGEHGTQCRSMTAQEEQALIITERSASLQPIGEEKRAQLQQQTGLKINLRATDQLNSFPQAKASFLRAAAKWEAHHSIAHHHRGGCRFWHDAVRLSLSQRRHHWRDRCATVGSLKRLHRCPRQAVE